MIEEETTHTEADRLIERSVQKYRRAHRRYDRRHPEIFNEVEQERLHASLRDALAAVRSGAQRPRVLDAGCGTGNLTRHLLELGAHVVAADVSPEFLRAIERRFGATGRVETLRLNGRDLAQLADGSLDMVCAYSVLHHIPDYLAAVEEMGRVLAPGGILYLDHEAAPAFWDADGCFRAMLREIDEATWWNPRVRRWQRYLSPSAYHLKIRRRFNPAYPWDVEGDIHVWPEDHVEWDEVEAHAVASGCEVVRRQDYLNYSRDYPRAIWDRYRAQGCTSMRVLVARRTG